MSNGDAFISICFFATCGAGLSIFLLTFNIKYRSLRFIKMTSPNINAIILTASFGLYGCCVLLIMEPSAAYSAASATALCQVRVWLLSTSVVTYLAAMFAKGWRVSRLFHYSSIRRIIIKDTTLLGIVAAFFAGNGAVLLLWYLVDPLQCLDSAGGGGAAASAARPNATLWPAMRVDYSSVSCQSRYFHAWSCGLFLYAVGVVLACVVVGWRIRHIRSPSLDDSQCILFTVNSSLVIAAVATWVGGSLDTVASAGPAVYSCALWVATTLSLCFNFVPKVHAVLKNAGKEPAQLGASKYLSSDLVTDRILTQMTAEVSTILSGKHDSVGPDAEAASDPRQRSEASSLHGSSESAHERAAGGGGGGGDVSRPSYADRVVPPEEQNEEGQGRCTRFGCNPLPRKSRLPDVVSLRCLWPLPEQRRTSSSSTPTATPPPQPAAAVEGADASWHRGVAASGQTSRSGGGLEASPVPRYLTMDRRCNDDLILSIADTYNLPDDVDTYSYISSWIPMAATHCAFCPRPRHAAQPGGGGGQLATIGSDQLYPSAGARVALDRGFHSGRRRRSERRPPPPQLPLSPPGGSRSSDSRGSTQPPGAELDLVVV